MLCLQKINNEIRVHFKSQILPLHRTFAHEQLWKTPGHRCSLKWPWSLFLLWTLEFGSNICILLSHHFFKSPDPPASASKMLGLQGVHQTYLNKRFDAVCIILVPGSTPGPCACWVPLNCIQAHFSSSYCDLPVFIYMHFLFNRMQILDAWVPIYIRMSVSYTSSWPLLEKHFKKENFWGVFLPSLWTSWND